MKPVVAAVAAAVVVAVVVQAMTVSSVSTRTLIITCSRYSYLYLFS